MTSPSTHSAMESSSGSKVDGAETPSLSSNVSESNQTNHYQVAAILKRLWDGILHLCGAILHLCGGILHLWGHHLPVEEEDVVVYNGVAQISKKRFAWSDFLVSDLVDLPASFHDKTSDLLGYKIEMQLISVDLDQGTKSPKMSATSSVKGWVTDNAALVADYYNYEIHFKVPTNFGEIGAVVINNNHPHEFFLQKLTLEGPDKKSVDFNTLAWIYPHEKYSQNRVFFSSTKYITSETPEGLKEFREQELEQTRGDGKGKREPWDRIYDYDVYNDYGNPDKDITLKRPVLGGSKDYRYPRRIRTGRAMSKADPNSESELNFHLEVPYIPSDEFFARTKNTAFLAAYVQDAFQSILPSVTAAFEDRLSFQNRNEIASLYEDGLPARTPSLLSKEKTPDVSDQKKTVTVYLAPEGEKDLTAKIYPRPAVVMYDVEAWEMDEEFGRQTLAGLNPSVIQAVKEYPPKSSLDPSEYGEGTALTDDHILPYLKGEFPSVAEAISHKRLFTVDYRDALLSLVSAANADTKNGFKCYSPRVILFFNKDGKMMPIAIELSLPPSKKGGKALNKVFTPADNHLWGLAKIHFNAVDSNYHQVYSHFTETHATVEPIIIATRRQISALHPIFPLLVPHFKDTMNINAAARQILIGGGGQIEENFSFGAQALVAGAKAYGAFWRFDHLNPARRLIDRGMAEPADESHPGGVKLVIEDYPFAKDSLDLWDALYKWAHKYADIVYNGSDDAVKNDKEIQAWWYEIKNVGHADHKDASWWPEMDSINSLADAIASIGYTAGPYHAAVNFGQYAYGGFPLNKPTATRRFIPEKDSAEYNELEKDPEAFLFSTVASPSMATTAMTVLELLATHAPDEEYLGSETMAADYKANPKLDAAFRDFSDAIKQVEKNIIARNNDKSLINRHGPVQVPYMLLFPSSTAGLTGQGVPYSVSI